MTTKGTEMAAAATTTNTVAVPRSELARALRVATSIKAKAIHLDLTAEHVTVDAYTSEVAVRTTLDVPGADAGAGAGAVPRMMLAGVLPYLAHDCRLAFVEDHLTIRAGESTFRIRTLREDAAGTFKHDLDTEIKTAPRSFVFEAPILRETLRRALPFAATDWTRPVLCNVAVYPAATVAAATDSYRLAIVRYGDGPAGPADEEPLLINVNGAKALRSLLAKKLGTVTAAKVDAHLLIDFEDTRWSLKHQKPYREDEPVKFPKWWDLLPDAKAAATVKVDREDMLAASRAAAVVAGRNAPLRLRTKGAEAEVEAHTPGAAGMTRRLASAEVVGEELEVGFNPAFMADICATAPVERLTVRLFGPLRPALVEAARDQYLLMPIRLNV